MKKITIIHTRYWLGMLLLFIFISCQKQLDKAPETQLSDADFWKTTNDLKLAANYFYTLLPAFASDNGMYSDNRSADAYATAANNISDGSRQAPATDDDWNNNYALIRACNNLIAKSKGTTGEAALINRYIGEARFFRAWAYYNLVIRYGDVPLIIRIFDQTDTLINASRTPREKVIDSIYADLDAANATLQSVSEQAAADYGRVTKSTTLALKARMGLFEGTRQKFHGYGSPAKHLQIAKDASKAIITSGQHALYKHSKVTIPDSSYYYNFQYSGEGKSNKENILVTLYGADATNPIKTHQVVRNLEQGFTSPTRNLCDAYCYKDGLPYTKSTFDSSSPDKQIRSLSQFSNRDFRMAQTIFNKNSFFVSGNYPLTYTFSPTGYKTMKYFIVADWGPNVSFIDYQIIRYAEVLLTYAEASYELDGSISNADLDLSINLTRARGGLPKLTTALVTANGLNMREEIRRERRVELALEGHRYWDIIRWKIAETELPKDILGNKHFQDEYPSLPGGATLTTDGFIIVQKVANRKFNPQRDYLWPIPVNQLALQPALAPQNPNW